MIPLFSLFFFLLSLIPQFSSQSHYNSQLSDNFLISPHFSTKSFSLQSNIPALNTAPLSMYTQLISLLYHFGDWHNLNQTDPTLEYFTYNDGIISLTNNTGIKPTSTESWDFVFTIYDGEYVDMRYAKALVHVENPEKDLITDYEKAIFIIPNITLDISFGEADQSTFYQKCVGNFSLAFKDPSTKLPLKNYNPDYLKNFALQVSFISSQCPLSFDTSILTNSYPMSTVDVLVWWFICLIWMAVAIYLIHKNTCIKDSEMPFSSVILIISGDTYMGIFYVTTTFERDELLRLWSTYILVLTTLILIFKVLVEAIRKADAQYGGSPCKTCAVSFFLICIGVAIGCIPHIIPLIWLKLIPGLVIFPQILQRINNIYDYEACLQYEMSILIYLSVWMGYTYFYPGNVFKFSPKPLFVGTFLVLAFLQIVILEIRIRCDSRSRIRPPPPPVPQEDELFNYTLLIENSKDEILSETCPVCLEPLGKDTRSTLKQIFSKRRIYKAPCKHLYHAECLKIWMRRQQSCPYCREKLPPQS